MRSSFANLANAHHVADQRDGTISGMQVPSTRVLVQALNGVGYDASAQHRVSAFLCMCVKCVSARLLHSSMSGSMCTASSVTPHLSPCELGHQQ